MMSKPPLSATRTITLRNLDAARRYPQELPEDAPRRRRGEPHVCPADGTTLEPVVLTTYGEFGDPEVWRVYPLAVEGWMCGAGAHFEPAFLTPDEANQLLRGGIDAVRGGDLDLAEFQLRRVVSSWPGFASGRVNLGSIYLDRVKRAQAASAPAAEVRALLDVAIHQFEQALACDPPAPAEVRLMLGRIYARSDRAGKARPLLESLRQDPAVGRALKEQAMELLDELAARPRSPAPRSAPASGAAAVAEPLVPYIVTAAHIERRDAKLVQSGHKPEAAEGLLTLYPGVHLTVALDTPQGAVPFFAADLRERRVSLADLLPAARQRLSARLGSADLPVHTYSTTPLAIPPIWRPGVHPIVQGTDTAKVLVVGPSWMAAGAAATGALFQRAARELGSKALRVLIPHRDRAFVFLDNTDDEQANKTLAAGIARAEADGARPISDRMFALDAAGIMPAGRRALQWTLLCARRGATKEELLAELPVDVKWYWLPGEKGAPDALAGQHWRAPPFALYFEFEDGALCRVRVLGTVNDDFGALVDLDAKLRQSFPDVKFELGGGRPWDIEVARPIIEGKGTDRFKMATSIWARIHGFGDIHGSVFGFKKEDGRQGYGFELFYAPNELTLEGMDGR